MSLSETMTFGEGEAENSFEVFSINFSFSCLEQKLIYLLLLFKGRSLRSYRIMKENPDLLGHQLHRSVSMITQPLAEHLK